MGQSASNVVKNLVVRQIAAVLVVALIVGVVVWLAGRDGWWRAWGVALAAVLGSVLAAIPLLVATFADARTAAAGVMGGMLIRILAVGGILAVGVLAFGAPAAPAMVMVIPLYLAGLGAEVIFASRALWKQIPPSL